MKDRVIVLGASGMLGSKVLEVAIEQNIDVFGTVRNKEESQNEKRCLFDVEKDDINKLLDSIRPTAVINCIAINDSKESSKMQRINAEFPHTLAAACLQRNIRLVHISTDGVFSGNKGKYTSTDKPDPIDLYGESKLTGEISDAPHVTVRTSIIGMGKNANKSLVSWFLNEKGPSVKGFTKVFWSGLTTKALAVILLELATGEKKNITGVVHVSGEVISKFDLLKLLQKYFNKKIDIIPDDSVICDRSLIPSKDFSVPSIEKMVQEMAEENP